jgi:hypothetical protein
MGSRAPNDTHPEIERLLIEGTRRMSPARKLDRVGALAVVHVGRWFGPG